jgi:hypothetical protein
MMNPLKFNYEEGEYNFMIAFNLTKWFIPEIYSKLSPEEKKELLAFEEEIQKAIDNNDVFTPVYEEGKIKGKTLNIKKWNKLRDDLFKFVLKVRESSEKHGFGSPDKDLDLVGL